MLRAAASRSRLVRLATHFPLRSLCTAPRAFDHEDFTEKWVAAVADVPRATDPAQSASILRKPCPDSTCRNAPWLVADSTTHASGCFSLAGRLTQTKLLKYTDMQEAPEKFFLAHRLLSTVGLGGFGVRFTVQFNLFAGSILGLGGEAQVKQLDTIQESGKLGCFLLTEMQAGVLSGLIVETTADYDPSTQSFILHTPSDKAAKNWISQGYTAELGVVIADLRIAGKSHGPHAFLMQMVPLAAAEPTGASIPHEP